MTLELTPFDFAQSILTLGVNPETGNPAPLNLEPYPYLRAIYNTQSTDACIIAGRQVSKSVTLASLLIIHAVTNPHSISMFVTPLQEQAEVFSNQRLRAFLDSPVVHDGFFQGEGTIDQVFRKRLSNKAMILLGYAQRTADRIRGKSSSGEGSYLMFDESFTAGTPVAVPGGTKAIESLVAGDTVLSLCTSGLTTDKVVRTYAHGPRLCWRITFSDGRRIECTSSTRLWSNEGWVYAHQLVDRAIAATAAADSRDPARGRLPTVAGTRPACPVSRVSWGHPGGVLPTQSPGARPAGDDRSAGCVPYESVSECKPSFRGLRDTDLRGPRFPVYTESPPGAGDAKDRDPGVVRPGDLGGYRVLVHGRRLPVADRESRELDIVNFVHARFFQSRERASGLVVVRERDRCGRPPERETLGSAHNCSVATEVSGADEALPASVPGLQVGHYVAEATPETSEARGARGKPGGPPSPAAGGREETGLYGGRVEGHGGQSRGAGPGPAVCQVAEEAEGLPLFPRRGEAGPGALRGGAGRGAGSSEGSFSQEERERVHDSLAGRESGEGCVGAGTGERSAARETASPRTSSTSAPVDAGGDRMGPAMGPSIPYATDGPEKVLEGRPDVDPGLHSEADAGVPGGGGRTDASVEIVQIEFLGTRDVYDIETETHHNFIASGLCVHNCQDIDSDVIPIIKELAFRVKNPRYRYCGTPKSLANPIHRYWSASTGNEWAAKCQACNYWNHDWTEKNIGKVGIVCAKCGAPLNTDRGQWVARRAMSDDAGVVRDGYRIPQLIVKPIMDDPGKWRELLHKVRTYPTETLYNEVFGLSYDSATQPVTIDHLKACCRTTEYLDNVPPRSDDPRMPKLCLGVDWAIVGEDSFTTVVVGGWETYPTKFNVYYWKRYSGHETDPDVQIDDICRLFAACGAHHIGADWGMGVMQNREIARRIGRLSLSQFLYFGGGNSRGDRQARIKWDNVQSKWGLSKLSVVTDTLEMIRRRQVSFPAFQNCDILFDNILAVQLEQDEKRGTSKYVHSLPDDLLHSVVYCMMAAELMLRGQVVGLATASPSDSPLWIPGQPGTPDAGIGGMDFDTMMRGPEY